MRIYVFSDDVVVIMKWPGYVENVNKNQTNYVNYRVTHTHAAFICIQHEETTYSGNVRALQPHLQAFFLELLLLHLICDATSIISNTIHIYEKMPTLSSGLPVTFGSYLGAPTRI